MSSGCWTRRCRCDAGQLERSAGAAGRSPPPSCATSTWPPCTRAAAPRPPPAGRRVSSRCGKRGIAGHRCRAQGSWAACALYLKDHSYGEYVFDWAWANAYHQHGLAYYPKAVVAVPFTPVPGSRLLARDAPGPRRRWCRRCWTWCGEEGLSSLHLLFGNDEDVAACEQAGLMLRHTVQFHWQNTPPGLRDFDDFLASLSQEKRKKIRQERRKVLGGRRHASAGRRAQTSRHSRLGLLLPLLRAHLSTNTATRPT